MNLSAGEDLESVIHSLFGDAKDTPAEEDVGVCKIRLFHFLYFCFGLFLMLNIENDGQFIQLVSSVSGLQFFK